MNPKRGLNAYKQADVLTANRETILLMLYEGAIRFLKAGILGVEQNNVEQRSTNLLRAQDIVTELRCTLDFKTGGDIAVKLESLYEYITERMIEGNIQNNATPLRDALKIIEDLHQTWTVAVATYRKEKEREKQEEAKNATGEPNPNK